ncbi:hypothetical protein [Rhodoferax sp.]|uniref:hypothetical protein n=1 Tax=Rhodoferax sp. TaxID=50421 RepID=UPI0025F2DF2C|nr:hypothetical protein [Rhodoferax sp.]
MRPNLLPLLPTALLRAATLALTGCGSFLREGTGVTAGIGGAALASTLTHNAAVATGIGVGVQAVAQAGLQMAERNAHQDEQNHIAQIAGALKVGEVARWKMTHKIPLEPDEQGEVTVSRTIGTEGGKGLDCREIVFSVEMTDISEFPRAFYVATICRNGQTWQWASAEPATGRWGALQ